MPPITTTWRPDRLGPGFENLTVPLGPDPDKEGEIVVTVVRYRPPGAADPAGSNPTPPAAPRMAFLHVHGFTDYFFQRHLAEWVDAEGLAFYAVDLRKCGRSRRAGNTPHFVSDLTLYDEDLAVAMEAIRAAGHTDVVIEAHSTGGLIVPLWLDRLAGSARAGLPAADRPATTVRALILNSPWFDLQVPDRMRATARRAVRTLGRVRGRYLLPRRPNEAYGAGLHVSRFGEYDFDLDLKPLTGFGIRLGWLRAVLVGQARLHRGLRIGVPTLVLHSTESRSLGEYSAAANDADVVLSIRQMARWSGCLGARVSIVPVAGARHDVFCSRPEARMRAFREVRYWWETLRRLDLLPDQPEGRR